jgi:hypothetical protein
MSLSIWLCALSTSMRATEPASKASCTSFKLSRSWASSVSSIEICSRAEAMAMACTTVCPVTDRYAALNC